MPRACNRAAARTSGAVELATLGDGSAAAGDAALRDDRGPDWRRWLLWSVLAIGALLVLVVSLRVLRHPAPGA